MDIVIVELHILQDESPSYFNYGIGTTGTSNLSSSTSFHGDNVAGNKHRNGSSLKRMSTATIASSTSAKKVSSSSNDAIFGNSTVILPDFDGVVFDYHP